MRYQQDFQKNFSEKLLEEFNKFFFEKSIKSKKSFSLSTPNRLVIVFEDLDKVIKIPSEEIKGPNINSRSSIGRFYEVKQNRKKRFIKKKN